MGVYIHNPRSWRPFRVDQEKLTTPLAAVRHRQGRLIAAWKLPAFLGILRY